MPTAKSLLCTTSLKLFDPISGTADSSSSCAAPPTSKLQQCTLCSPISKPLEAEKPIHTDGNVPDVILLAVS
ncbi:hypothetical protein RJT34_04109 [Clitoria ternatea]|uniref:Uncharacterized protein n=1 Tax=Clitoria ternatea TaxID=43366 RepID=A0AAN9KNE0_CLITE